MGTNFKKYNNLNKFYAQDDFKRDEDYKIVVHENNSKDELMRYMIYQIFYDNYLII